ncbi:hypothetical protein ACJDU8_14265 [Clostridium sp. WILCCON 0269]|uniref:DUF4830 domain-containing protein n=1 Tax=Candidatus Clostridium eludens TaxID=3381663 RepID=A0ABW8SMX8_9CLOT
MVLALLAWGIITYRSAQTKQFSYVPAYNSEMKATCNSSPNKYGVSSSSYTIKNTTRADVLQNYENILKKNGWTITEEHKPSTFTATKDKHRATLIAMQNNKDVDIIMISR